MSWRPHPKRTTLNIDQPDPWGTCDRSGFIGDHSRMKFQFQWAGSALINTGILVHPDQYDVPSDFLRTLIIPPDPDPLFNARPEPYTIDETDWLVTDNSLILQTDSGTLLVTHPSATEADTES